MSSSSGTSTIFLCGDVMTGRGVDQILAHPGDPTLYEPHAESALEYVALAEHAHGSIPWPVSDRYVWGVALEELEERRPDSRIINLETSITTSEHAAPKGINYRMNPANAPVLAAAGIDCAVLANNHVLDWGRQGLLETLDVLTDAGIRTAGAGRTLRGARSPAILDVASGGRLLVFAFGAEDSGIPRSWVAGAAEPGVDWIEDYSVRTVTRIAGTVSAVKREGDVAIASIHWGANWSYEVLDAHQRFAHDLIERAGIDLVHGHSSHHVKAIEVFRGHAILYGCGDFLNDYEGIVVRENFRNDLALMYFPTLNMNNGELVRLAMVPLLIRNFRLQRPSAADARWLHDTLDRECRAFDCRVLEHDHEMLLEWRRFTLTLPRTTSATGGAAPRDA